MTTSNNYVPTNDAGNGITVAFTFPYDMILDSYSRVYLEDDTTKVQTLQTLTTHYTISFTESGGTVTMITAPPTGDNLIIAREVELDQTDNYKTSKGFDGSVLEDSLDKLTGITQDIKDKADRAIGFPVGSGVTDIEYPLPVANKALLWNSGATALINSTDDFNDIVSDATAQAVIATSQATNASNSAIDAALSAAKLQGTSTTSLLIAIASKVFVTEADKFFDASTWLLITSDADPTNYMHGQVTAYSGTSLTVNVTNIGGSGTLADWTIQVSGTQGSVLVGLANVVDDTTPQLGGNLDVNSFTITGLDANETAKGIVERATDAEVATGTDTTRYITPKQLADNAGGGGAMVLLGTATASASTSIDFTSLIDSTYDEYVIEIDDMTVSNYDAAILLRMSVDNGATWLTNSYTSIGNTDLSFSNTVQSMYSQVWTGVRLSHDTGGYGVSNTQAGDCYSGTTKIYNVNSSNKKRVFCTSSYDLGAAGRSGMGVYAGSHADTGTVNALRLILDAGTITTGDFRLYGIVKV